MTILEERRPYRARSGDVHPGLPEKWNRDRFRQLCVQFARLKGCSAECVLTLQAIIETIPPNYYTDTKKRPLCFARQETLANVRSISTRSLRNHEIQLEKIGLIVRVLGVNGARCKRKGLGLCLIPALSKINQMQAELASQTGLHKKRDKLRGQRCVLLRQIIKGSDNIPARYRDQIRAALAKLPRADTLRTIRLSDLTEQIAKLRRLLWKIKELTLHSSDETDSTFRRHTEEETEDEKNTRKPKDKILAHPSTTQRTNYEPNVQDLFRASTEITKGFIDSEQRKLGIHGLPDNLVYSGFLSTAKLLGVSNSVIDKAVISIGHFGASVLCLIVEKITSWNPSKLHNPSGFFMSLLKKLTDGSIDARLFCATAVFSQTDNEIYGIWETAT